MWIHSPDRQRRSTARAEIGLTAPSRSTSDPAPQHSTWGGGRHTERGGAHIFIRHMSSARYLPLLWRCSLLAFRRRRCCEMSLAVFIVRHNADII